MYSSEGKQFRPEHLIQNTQFFEQMRLHKQYNQQRLLVQHLQQQRCGGAS